MAISKQFYLREDLHGKITPNWRVQPNISAPHGKGDWRPAAWLPIVWEASEAIKGKDAYVISSGKVVALDAEDRIVPAGLRGALVGAATSTVVLTYTATDVKWGVQDFTTGKKLTAPKTVTSLEFAKAVVDRGFVTRAAAPSNTTHIQEVIQAFISLPIGVAAADFHVYAGTPERGDQHFLNYNKQHLVQFLTEHEVHVPYMASDTVVDDLIDVSAVTLATSATSGQRPADGAVLDADGIKDLGRYDADLVGDVVLIVLSERDVAAHTSRTPLACDVDGVLARQRPAIENVTAVGDYFLDAQAGYLVLSRAAWDTLVSDNTDPTFSFYVYSSSALAASEQYIYFTGVPNFGDRRVSVDKASNFCPKGSAADILASTAPELGTLLTFDIQPKQLLQHVKTAWDLQGVTSASRMPGSATAGFTDHITLANEKVANQLVVIKVRI
jgi:hypothetical protein